MTVCTFSPHLAAHSGAAVQRMFTFCLLPSACIAATTALQVLRALGTIFMLVVSRLLCCRRFEFLSRLDFSSAGPTTAVFPFLVACEIVLVGRSPRESYFKTLYSVHFGVTLSLQIISIWAHVSS